MFNLVKFDIKSNESRYAKLKETVKMQSLIKEVE